MDTIHTSLPDILAVGIATLDIINSVKQYPCEDAEVRATAQRVTRGGNATNTLSVLSHLGHACAWAGVWVDEPDGRQILEILHAAGIDTRYSKRLKHGKTPVSYITLNLRNGSRTIVHYRDLPEFGFADFPSGEALRRFGWIHFEGRNVPETLRMLSALRTQTPRVPVSLEVEKPRADIETLFEYVDVLLFSKHFVQHTGYTYAQDFLAHWRRRLPATHLVCAWGEAGGYALAAHSHLLLHSPAYPPPRIVDTLGAGDTFNAGIIHALAGGQPLTTALEFACRLAGRKCGQVGFSLPSAGWEALPLS